MNRVKSLHDFLCGSCAIKINIGNMGAKRRPKVRHSPERASGRSGKPPYRVFKIAVAGTHHDNRIVVFKGDRFMLP